MFGCMEPPRLAINGISKRFVAGVPGCRAEVRALEHVSLCVRAGEVVSVLGGPGAGKTTLIHCAAGLLRPDGGEVRWCGKPVPSPTGVRLVSAHDHRLSARLALRAITRGAPDLLLVDAVFDDGDACDVHAGAERLMQVAASGAAVLVATRLASVARCVSPMCLRLDRGVACTAPAASPADFTWARVAEPAPRRVC